MEIVLSGERDPETGFVDEFAILIYERLWSRSGLCQHQRVRIEVERYEQPALNHRMRVWLAKRLEREKP